MAGNIPGTAGAKFPPAPGNYPYRPTFSRAPSGDRVRDLRGRFSGGMGINWYGLTGIVEDLAQQAAEGVINDQQMEQLAREVQQYARDHAPWEDHTYEARDGLTAIVQKRGQREQAIVLFHTVDYGVYLENANGGQFAIIIPTLEHFAAEIGSTIFGPGATTVSPDYGRGQS